MATKFQYYITGLTDANAVDAESGIGQQFTVATAHSIEYIKILVRKYGSPPNLIIEIQGVDGDGFPDGVVLCSCIKSTDIFSAYPSAAEWQQIDFSTPADLQANTMYVIIAYIENWGGDGSNKVGIYSDDSVATYIGGRKIWTNDEGTTWNDEEFEDFGFEEWGTEIVSGVMFPAIAPSLEALGGW